MSLLHWYIIPIAWELGFNREVLENFVQFVNIIEVAMSHSPKSDKDVAALYNLVKSFLEEFKRLYVHNNPEKVSRCRLCIWQINSNSRSNAYCIKWVNQIWVSSYS